MKHQTNVAGDWRVGDILLINDLRTVRIERIEGGLVLCSGYCYSKFFKYKESELEKFRVKGVNIDNITEMKRALGKA